MPTLRGRRATNDRLAKLRNLYTMWRLDLYDTAITDDGMSVLVHALELRQLCIRSNILTDQCMAVVASIPLLQSLLIYFAPLLTDTGVAQLAQRSSLRELYLHNTRITDHALSSLGHLIGLTSVSLAGTQVTDLGVPYLASLNDLDMVSLERTQVAGYGLSALVRDNPLDVYLRECPVTDDAVIEFSAELKNLRRLGLDNTAITDRCMGALASLPRIDLLRLSNTHVTDRGVQSLLGHSSLGAIELGGTVVSEVMKQKLRDASPCGVWVSS